MIPGYHAGEMWLHEPSRAIGHLADIGFRSVAIRSRQGICVPGETAFEEQWQSVIETATKHAVNLVIDTEALFVVGAGSESPPSLVAPNDPDSAVIRNWIESWIRAAALRPGTIVSLASGPLQTTTTEVGLEILAERLEKLCCLADSVGVRLAIRPAASHVIASVAQFERLRQWLPSGISLGLAADVGEMIQAAEMPLVSRLQRQTDDLRVVYLCDSGNEGSDANTGAGGVGRMDVPIGTGEVAVERIVTELAKFTHDVPVIVRVANQAASGLDAPRRAMRELRSVTAWREACR